MVTSCSATKLSCHSSSRPRESAQVSLSWTTRLASAKSSRSSSTVALMRVSTWQALAVVGAQEAISGAVLPSIEHLRMVTRSRPSTVTPVRLRPRPAQPTEGVVTVSRSDPRGPLRSAWGSAPSPTAPPVPWQLPPWLFDDAGTTHRGHRLSTIPRTWCNCRGSRNGLDLQNRRVPQHPRECTVAGGHAPLALRGIRSN